MTSNDGSWSPDCGMSIEWWEDARFKAEVAGNVHCLMQDQDIDPEVLAAKLGKSRQWMSLLLAGELDLRLGELAQIYLVFGRSVHLTSSPAGSAARFELKIGEE